MHICTDRVINKMNMGFPSPTSPQSRKTSQEYQVLAILRYLYSEEFKTAVKGESPDLQDSAGGFGMEVVCAASEKDFEASDAYLHLCSEDGEINMKVMETIDRCGYSIGNQPFGEWTLTSVGTADDKEKNIFQNAIRQKTNKLSKYKSSFERIGLAIYLPDSPTTVVEENAVEWITEICAETPVTFDNIFVITHRYCIRYDAREKRSEKKLLTNDEVSKLRVIGRMTAENELTLADIEWS